MNGCGTLCIALVPWIIVSFELVPPKGACPRLEGPRLELCTDAPFGASALMPYFTLMVTVAVAVCLL